MIKLQSFLVRREEMSHEAFRDYWLTEHVPLARELDGLRRYRTAVPIRPAASRYDGIAELYFDSVADLDAVLGPESDTEAIRDVPNFESTSDRHVVTETVHRDDLGDATRSPKLVAVVHRPPALSREAFVDRWLDDLRPAAVPALRKLTTAVPVDPARADCDGIVECYVDDVAALETPVEPGDGDAGDGDDSGTDVPPLGDAPVGRVERHLVEEIVQLDRIA